MLKIRGKRYESKNLDALTLKDILTVESELAALGIPRAWQEIRKAAARLDQMTADEFEDDPDGPLMVALLVWAARRGAGETVTFTEAIDVPLSDFEFLPDTGDHKAPKATPRKRKAPAAE